MCRAGICTRQSRRQLGTNQGKKPNSSLPCLASCSQVEIKPEMVGHYLAEFSITYKPTKRIRDCLPRPVYQPTW